MATTADFRNGLTLEWNNDLYSIVEFQHVKPGKGGAFVRTKLRNIKTGRVLENTFTAGEKVVTARVEKREFQYLYKDELGYNFMDNESFEQISLSEEMVPKADLMKEGSTVEILIHTETETPLSVDMPAYVELRVTYTEPGVKGDTATNASKPAPNMLMFDRITDIQAEGGEHGLGFVKAELDINKDLWFFQCHFPGDPVMPGCLGLDAMWQLVGFFLGWRGGPGKGRALGVGKVKFKGEVLDNAKIVRYEINLKKIIERGQLIMGIADGKVFCDNEHIYTAEDLQVGLIPPKKN